MPQKIKGNNIFRTKNGAKVSKCEWCGNRLFAHQKKIAQKL